MTARRFPSGALDLARAYAQHAFSARELVEHTLARIAADDGRINAFTTVTAERALAEAASLDARRASGAPLPPLAGVPFAAKNLFDIEQVTTTAGSRVLADDPPAQADAFLVRRLREQGAILIGALNMDEFAYGFTTENHHAGPCRNPHDTTRTAGGSSGGSAAAVAADFVPLALGSDTNGSVRVPASCCGVFGVKPTYGRLSRSGTFPFVASLDHLGAFARSVDDLAAVYDALQGRDPDDPAQTPREAEPVGAGRIAALRVARLGGYFDEHAGDDARGVALEAANALGARETVEYPDAAVARGAAFLITASEGGQLHLPTLRTRYDDHEPLSRDRLIAGALLPAAWLLHAQRARAVLRRRVLELFERHDVLIAPATPVVAPPIGAAWMDVNGQRLPVRPNLGLLTQPVSCLGLPVVAVPLRTASGLPLAVQLIAAPWREDLAFEAARRLEAAGLAYVPAFSGATPPVEGAER
ncbi:AtzE family amidohydrolase [Paraburkholderia caballeronis]|uniref:Aspartyl-tRNA(Asn)/glutamyl-tRNA(Gln) amidotransferase subunit A n=1 Tax=Paraburkholderia caballeronis TaxID=416943 RepID=A0A1H7LBU5_9BURK|nr:AtzE family amidohydrolase [Paraburkholderia caballeronis]PXW28377.1 aspartyl-tRNA(Asn)/glutamyl-tRNA(Gln) amidotransferase subunit A [Paraburkholderia caballeronis]PXX03743.1 aspartyl-tRNA(Asn)/glutamyl-tRNA(Gln) amidotransferase subunit A [Paraburkholderia caballeronis]RAK04487.1 aspartyl-tRNA(Asn)/glutamyl-tRNA(Gln) amidotransferase subunit A [Paraburkholderia caballeronis]TDV19392.1 aspartyl-tRNA(Asn)/glutamyl-tRNA(Gln) amidotransferase subunit A [Paraburkholderia caballeronis]TDV21992.